MKTSMKKSSCDGLQTEKWNKLYLEIIIQEIIYYSQGKRLIFIFESWNISSTVSSRDMVVYNHLEINRTA